jgi:hypothetical protein
MHPIAVDTKIAHGIRDLTNELLQGFTNSKIPLSLEAQQMWSSLRDARDNFFAAVTTKSVNLSTLLRLKSAITKSERFIARSCPA